MYTVKKTWQEGYVMLPCFTVKMLKGGTDAQLTCGPVREWIFKNFFAMFWTGAIHITKEYTTE